MISKEDVTHTPCITINAREWFEYPGFEDFLCQETIATYTDQAELNRNRYNRRKGYDDEEYTPGNDDVFLWAEWDGERDAEGRPGIVGDVEILEECCPKVWDELVDLLLEIGFKYGVVRLCPV